MLTSELIKQNTAVLIRSHIRLEPLTSEHVDGLALACQDGELWTNRVTSVPYFKEVDQYLAIALKQQSEAVRMPFVVIDELTNQTIGTTSYHDILLAPQRVEIGYTWYAKRYQRTHINTTCKFLLLQHAFEQMNINTVGFRTDQFNFVSQKAIERLGAKKDGVIRGHAERKDGTIRDTVMYSISRGEWENVKAHLLYLMHEKYLEK